MGSERDALAAFLRSRRDRLTPARAGIPPFPGARRVPGLRKEEVAFLAGLSTDHYSRIEQGRQRFLTDQVIGALARALQLDETEQAHLRDMAGSDSARHLARRPRGAPQRSEPGMLRLMTALDHVPVLLLGRRSNVLARNALLCAVLDHPMPVGSSFVRWLFTEPAARTTIINWADFAEASIGGLRLELGRRPDDRVLRKLIDELRTSDPAAARWWDDQSVTDRTSLTKRINHHIAGQLTFNIETVVGPHDPEQRLVVYTVEPGSATAAALPILASWGQDESRPVDR